jgi:hypothetical protein
MASTFSTSLRLELQASGENRATWGQKANNVFEMIEDGIAGYITIPVLNTGADTVLTTNSGTADQARNMMLDFTGTLSANRTVVIPAVAKTYIAKNSTSGGFAVVLKVGATSNILTLGPSQIKFVYTNGTLIWSNENWIPMSSSWKRWDIAVSIDAGGFADVGKAIDFHNTNTNATDWNVRLGTTNKASVVSTTDLYLLAQGAAQSTASKIWHEGNDGPASTLDADTLDGKHASEIVFDEPPNDGKLYARKRTSAGVASWVLIDVPWTVDTVPATAGDVLLKFGANTRIRIKSTGLILTENDIEVFSTSVGT